MKERCEGLFVSWDFVVICMWVCLAILNCENKTLVEVHALSLIDEPSLEIIKGELCLEPCI